MDRTFARREMSLGVFPWIIFAVFGRNAGQGTAWASAAALFTVLLVSQPWRRFRNLRILEVTGIFVFSGLLIAGLIAGDSRDNFVNDYGRALAFGCFALMAIGSLFFVPWVEQYSREVIRPRYWTTPGFRQINRLITAFTAVGFTLITTSFVLGQIIETSLANTLFNWVFPIVLGGAARVIGQNRWNEYYDTHSTAAEDVMAQTFVLDTLFMTPAREVERESR
jgi:hypothetical protein